VAQGSRSRSQAAAPALLPAVGGPQVFVFQDRQPATACLEQRRSRRSAARLGGPSSAGAKRVVVLIVKALVHGGRGCCCRRAKRRSQRTVGGPRISCTPLAKAPRSNRHQLTASDSCDHRGGAGARSRSPKLVSNSTRADMTGHRGQRNPGGHSCNTRSPRPNNGRRKSLANVVIQNEPHARIHHLPFLGRRSPFTVTPGLSRGARPGVRAPKHCGRGPGGALQMDLTDLARGKWFTVGGDLIRLKKSAPDSAELFAGLTRPRAA